MQRDGVGENNEQLTIRMSMSFGLNFELFNTRATTSNMTSWLSERAPATDWSGSSPFNVRTMPGGQAVAWLVPLLARSEEHTSELQSLMRISYAVFCLQNK